MISKTSLFNLGIYKSTVKRNIWGSIVYFAVLFLFTSLPLISRIDNVQNYRISAIPYLYRSGYMVPPLIVAVIVPTIMAMLVFRFIHSKKVSVFTHSLPISRQAIFISTLSGAFTIMFLPVLANGIILCILSLTAYSAHFSLSNCLVWMALNVIFLFVMFSVSTFSAVITGHIFAAPVINVLIHILPMLVIAGFSVVANHYLYGYANDEKLLSTVVENNPVVWIMSVASKISYNVPNGFDMLFDMLSVMLIVAFALYILSFVIYFNRKMETTEDIAPFAILNPIYKYVITFVTTLGAFAIFVQIFEDNNYAMLLSVAIVTLITYFGCEMLLKKTFNVWRSYKGFFVFAVCFVGMICFFAFTSFFGFETRVPDVEDVQSVAIYNYYYNGNEPYSEDDAIKQIATETHREFVTFNDIIQTNNKLGYSTTRIHIRYKLKNGATLNRVYLVKQGTCVDVMNKLYKHNSYKMVNEGIFRPEEIAELHINGRTITVENKQKVYQLVECIKQDVLSLDYSKIHIDGAHFNYNIELVYKIPKHQNDIMYAYEYTSSFPIDGYTTQFEHISVNANYQNTINWLKQNGYWEAMKPKFTGEVYIGKKTSRIDEFGGKYYEYEKMTTVSGDKTLILRDFIESQKPDCTYNYQYMIYGGTDGGGEYHITRLTDEELQSLSKMLDIKIQ